jgi:homoserine dehydrogenase
VQVRGEKGGDFVFSGRGAGGDPTAVAVLSDIVELARSGPRPLVPPLGFPAFEPFSPAGPEEFSAPFYLRFVVRDKAGIIAGISQILARNQANIEAVFQAPYGERDALPFVITLETVTQAQVAKALEEIAALDFHVVPPVAFPMTD